jgi:hypothetical protein
MEIFEVASNKPSIASPSRTLRETLIVPAIILLSTCLFLFVGMSLRPSVYDEGLILTGAMRVAAGQLPYRDFYAYYGPVQFYMFAGAFKLFGQSLLVERLICLVIEGLLVTSVYIFLSDYCRRSIAVSTSLLTAIWLFGISATGGSPLIPTLLLNIVGCGLVLPVFTGAVSKRRMLAAGAVAGLGFLVRYDTGLALLGVQAIVIVLAVFLRTQRDRLRTIAAIVWPSLLGFAVVTAPPAVYYLSIAPFHALLYDNVLYPSKYYRAARGLPFPGISLKTLENVAIYLPIGAVLVSLYVAKAVGLRSRARDAFREPSIQANLGWCGFLLTFSILASVMYFKGIVRISVPQVFLAIIPSLLLVAILIQKRQLLSRSLRITVGVLAWGLIITAGWASLHMIKGLYNNHSSVPEHLIASLRGTLPAVQSAWCKSATPLTVGLCFSSDDDRIRTVEYIDNHTTPDQTLFVGLPQHQVISINDNLVYFASQRLPATRWSDFNPDLQNRYDIQVEMVKELVASAPPYIVEDSEFALLNEPNDSSKSSGVTLLDDFINNNYHSVQVYGDMAIWQRIAKD